MPPDLSVILVVGERRDRAVVALASVLSQEAVDRLEVLLLDLAPGEPPPVPGSAHPAVRTVRLPPDTLFSAAKALGVARASAPAVAVLEEHCWAYPGWAAALIEAHRGPWAAVGAEVHNGNPSTPLSRTIAIINYYPWMAPARRAEHAMLPGHNSSFKRDVLLAYGNELGELLRAEIVLHVRLHRDGHRLLLEPAAKFAHVNESTLRSAGLGRFLWNRCYGPMRARTFGWPLARRAFYVLATPLVPVYSLVLLVSRLSRLRPDLVRPALAAAPQILALQLVSALGLALGLLFGIGNAEARFSLYEMNEYRQLESGGRNPERETDGDGKRMGAGS
jgi:GT2 family glycosyltransferase